MRSKLVTFFVLTTAFCSILHHDNKSQKTFQDGTPQSALFRQTPIPRSLLLDISSANITTTTISNLNFTKPGVSPRIGANVVILLTTYVANVNSTGQVWAIYAESHQSPEIVIQNLNTPTAICADVNNGYVYVIDSDYNSTKGVVYQYSATWNTISFDLNLSSSIVYQSAGPTDCDVDQYGNLYITDDTSQQILGISLANLKAQNYDYFILYSAHINQVTTVTSIDISDDLILYFLNAKLVGDSGLVNNGTAFINTTNDQSLQTLVNSVSSPNGLSSNSTLNSVTGVNLALSEKRLYYTVDRQGLYVYDLSNSSNVFKSNFTSPKGVCYADGYVYVADVNTAAVYQLKDSINNEASPTVYLELANPYAIECINSAIVLAAYVVVYTFF